MRSRVHACLSAVVSLLVWSLMMGEAFPAGRETGEPLKPTVSAERAAALAVNSLKEISDGYRLDHSDYVAVFNGQGLRFHPRRGGPGWSWQLKSVESRNEPVAGVTLAGIRPLEQTTGVIGYDRGALIEQYILRLHNIEQQFIIPESLELDGAALVIQGQVDSPGELVATEQGWLWHTSDGVVSLGDVHVFDARGRTLPATMTATAQGTRIVVDGTGLEGAAYPVTIDPEIGTNDFRISNPFQVTNPIKDNNDPVVAYNSTNNEYLVVWRGDPAVFVVDNLEIFSQRIDASNGARLGFQRVSSMGVSLPGFTWAAFDPDVAYNSTNNEYLVVWEADDNFGLLEDDEFEVYGQRLDGETGAEIGANDFRISDLGPDGDPNFDAGDADVAYNSIDNEYLVVWRGDDVTNGENEVYSQRLNAATGAEIGPNDFRISDLGPDGDPEFDASDPAVAYNSRENSYLVVWKGDDVTNGENEVYSQRLNAATGAEIGPNDLRVSDVGPAGDPDFDADDSNVAYNSTNNEFLIVWDADPVTDGVNEIYGQRFSDTARLYFAQFGNGTGLSADLVLGNPSASSTVTGQVDFFDDNGLPLNIGIAGIGSGETAVLESSPMALMDSVAFSVPPLGKATISTDGIGDVVVGAAVVTSPNTLAGVVRFSISGIGIAGVGSSTPVGGFLTPVRRESGGINTGVALYNPGSQAVTLNLPLRASDGQTVTGGTSTIADFPASGHLAQFIDTLFPDADTADFEGTLVVEVTGGTVAATALELGTSDGQFTTLPVTSTADVTSDAQNTYFAQFENGTGLTSGLILVNPSATATVSGQVQFFDDNGLPLMVGIADAGSGAFPLGSSPQAQVESVAFSVPPLGKTTILSDGEGAVVVGSAVVNSDSTVGGVVRFNISGIGIAGVGSSTPLRGFLTPVRRQVGGINTGVAVLNIGAEAVTLNLTLRASDGQTVDNGTSIISDFPASGHLAQFIDTLFPDADTSDFEGILVVEVTGGTVAATALELGTSAGQFTTLPVTALE